MEPEIEVQGGTQTPGAQPVGMTQGASPLASPQSTVTHTLAYPIEIKSEGRTITEVTMRRSKVRDQRIAAQGGGTSAEMEIRLVAFLCGISPETMDEMDDKDYSALQDIYRRFLS